MTAKPSTMEMITASKDIVIICLALNPGTGDIDSEAPFVVIPSNLGRCGMYENRPDVIAQFLPGERQARFEAEWADGEWKFGRRVDDEDVGFLAVGKFLQT